MSGRGQWDSSKFLDPEFFTAFQELQMLELERPDFRRGLPNIQVDEPGTILKLFEKWDDFGLLCTHPKSSITTGDSGRVKIFTAYKPEQWDRQIGDRRERNGWEARVPGPSTSLPVGPMIGVA